MMMTCEGGFSGVANAQSLMKSLEWKSGLMIGAANMVWLLLSWLLGWHNSGIGLFQVAITLGFFITLTGFVLAFRAIAKAEPETTFLEGVKSGSIIAAVSAALAALGWVVYLTGINPGLSASMVEETRNHFASSGLDAGQIDLIAAQAEKTFGLASYATQAGLGALVQGVVFSAIIMGIIRRRAGQQ